MQVLQSLVTRVVVEHDALHVVGCRHGPVASEDKLRRRLEENGHPNVRAPVTTRITHISSRSATSSIFLRVVH